MALYKNFISKDRLSDYELLLALIRADSGEDERQRIVSSLDTKNIDWSFVCGLAEKHRVLPVFYSNLKSAGLQSHLPDSLQKTMSERYLAIVGNNLKLQNRLFSLLAMFESREITAVPFKGPILAHCLYGDGTLRYYQDLDILVPTKCVIPARDALVQSNYVPGFKVLLGRQLETVLKYGREASFVDHSGKVLIDLHWQLCYPFGRVYDYDFCKKRLRVIRLNNRNVHSLSQEDTLLHLCLTGTHDIWHNLERMSCVADYIVQRPSMDWGLVQKLAGKLRCRRALLLGLFFARDIFDVAMPLEIVDQVEKDKTILKLAGKNYVQLFHGTTRNSHIEKRVSQLPYYLKIRESFLDKLVYLLRRIFVPTKRDWRNMPVSARFSFLMFVRRPFAMAAELLRAKVR